MRFFDADAITGMNTCLIGGEIGKRITDSTEIGLCSGKRCINPDLFKLQRRGTDFQLLKIAPSGIRTKLREHAPALTISPSRTWTASTMPSSRCSITWTEPEGLSEPDVTTRSRTSAIDSQIK